MKRLRKMWLIIIVGIVTLILILSMWNKNSQHIMAIRGLLGIDDIYVVNASLRINNNDLSMHGLVRCVHQPYSPLPRERGHYPDGFYKSLGNGHSIEIVVDGICPGADAKDTDSHPLIVDERGEVAIAYVPESPQLQGSHVEFRKIQLDDMFLFYDKHLLACGRPGVGGVQHNTYYIADSVIEFGAGESIASGELAAVWVSNDVITDQKVFADNGYGFLHELNDSLHACSSSGSVRTRCDEFVKFASSSLPIISILGGRPAEMAGKYEHVTLGGRGSIVLFHANKNIYYLSPEKIMSYDQGSLGVQRFMFCYAKAGDE